MVWSPFLECSPAVGLQLLESKQWCQPWGESFAVQNLLALIISDQLGIRQLAVQDNSDGKSNLKKVFALASWELSQWPTLTGFFSCIIKWGYSVFPSATVRPSAALKGLFHSCGWTFSYNWICKAEVLHHAEGFQIHRILLEQIMEYVPCGLWWNSSLLLCETGCITFILDWACSLGPLGIGKRCYKHECKLSQKSEC